MKEVMELMSESLKSGEVTNSVKTGVLNHLGDFISQMEIEGANDREFTPLWEGFKKLLEVDRLSNFENLDQFEKIKMITKGVNDDLYSDVGFIEVAKSEFKPRNIIGVGLYGSHKVVLTDLKVIYEDIFNGLTVVAEFKDHSMSINAFKVLAPNCSVTEIK